MSAARAGVSAVAISSEPANTPAKDFAIMISLPFILQPSQSVLQREYVEH
jgi:hypothetical protein